MDSIANRLLVAWLAYGMVCGLTARLAFEYLWVAGFFPALAWLAVGLALLAWFVVQLLKPALRRRALRRIAALCVGAALVVYTFPIGSWATQRIRFGVERGNYDRVVAALRDHPAPAELETLYGTDFIVDIGPPMRVAFPWPGGIVDNWCGIVHDPTAEVLKVNEFTLFGEAWRASPITRLFGGDITSCTRQDGGYFFCCFT